MKEKKSDRFHNAAAKYRRRKGPLDVSGRTPHISTARLSFPNANIQTHQASETRTRDRIHIGFFLAGFVAGVRLAFFPGLNSSLPPLLPSASWWYFLSLRFPIFLASLGFAPTHQDRPELPGRHSEVQLRLGTPAKFGLIQLDRVSSPPSLPHPPLLAPLAQKWIYLAKFSTRCPHPQH